MPIRLPASAQRILKNSAALSVSVLFERMIAFLLPWYVARVRGPEIWGAYSTALNFLLIGVALGHWGLTQYLPREISRDKTQVGRFAVHGLVLTLIASVAILGAMLLILPRLSYDPSLESLIFLGAILVLIPNAEALLLESVIHGVERMEWIALVRLPLTLVRAGVALFFLLQGYSVAVLFIIQAIYLVVIVGAYLIILGRAYTFEWSIDRQMLRQMFWSALPFLMIVAVGEPIKQIDKLVLARSVELSDVGIYSTGILLVQLLQMVLPPALMNSLFPGLSRAFVDSAERFNTITQTLFRLLLLATYPIVLTLYVISSPLLPFVFGTTYTASVPIMQTAVWSLLPLIVAQFLFRVLLASNNEKLALPVAIARAVSYCILLFTLIPAIGIMGGAIALIGVELIGLLSNLFLVSTRVFTFNWWRTLILPILCITVSLAGFILIPNPLTGWLSAMALFIFAIFLTRTATKTDWAHLIGQS